MINIKVPAAAHCASRSEAPSSPTRHSHTKACDICTCTIRTTVSCIKRGDRRVNRRTTASGSTSTRPGDTTSGDSKQTRLSTPRGERHARATICAPQPIPQILCHTYALRTESGGPTASLGVWRGRERQLETRRGDTSMSRVIGMTERMCSGTARLA